MDRENPQTLFSDGGLAEFAETLANDAALMSMSWFRKRIDAELKADCSPVTQADREIEASIRNKIAENYPDHGILGEEYGRLNLDARHVWVVDPIDGTRSFITGWPIWGTLVCLLQDGKPELGIIDMPALGERWKATRGNPTCFYSAQGNVEICQTSACRSLEIARFYTTSLFYFENSDRPKIEKIAKSSATPRFGGDCYSYGLLASGHVDLVVEALLQPFDYFALVPIIEGAGGVITDWNGQPLAIGSDGRVVAAATPQLHAEVLQILRA
ncbi:histidinol-phosphatase [Pseudaminobacter soli (ex Li et al. 2025)]|uniref:histidinol-phosphatase n=1 Tax=Pseudaminobacter soli (ex Li et al. 2025) TaxID=1295366 RepID=UPI003CD010C9